MVASNNEQIARAVDKAIEKFRETLEEDNIEPSFYPINIEVLILDVNYEQVLRKLKFIEKEE
jgi:hypothetical protein